ncbi:MULTISPECIES: hypothetical protein [Brevibacillus]|jgi:hypothetical protein|uniref:hypothetical protein n=1 Tax=Brevibacillus TaxID=55080 RepID=UPI00156B036C|nr:MULTISPECIES: hypothetical protein [Brevibacillus]NRQ52932.1 hypothetical protein [Brevibacillus sp. HD1.4A]
MSNNERESLKKLERAISFFQKHWGVLVLWMVPSSLVLILALSIVYKSEQLDAFNAWISLILGFVATLLSIISTFLSFYNLEKANELNDENRQLMQKVEDRLSDLPDRTAQAVRTTFLSVTPSQRVEVRENTLEFDEL